MKQVNSETAETENEVKSNNHTNTVTNNYNYQYQYQDFFGNYFDQSNAHSVAESSLRQPKTTIISNSRKIKEVIKSKRKTFKNNKRDKSSIVSKNNALSKLHPNKIDCFCPENISTSIMQSGEGFQINENFSKRDLKLLAKDTHSTMFNEDLFNAENHDVLSMTSFDKMFCADGNHSDHFGMNDFEFTCPEDDNLSVGYQDQDNFKYNSNMTK